MPDFVRRIPEGDNRERLICADCGHIAYDNPKVVVGSVILTNDSVLMYRRAIEPRRGFWTLPAGYLEHGETLEEGAAREAWRDAGSGPLGVPAGDPASDPRGTNHRLRSTSGIDQ